MCFRCASESGIMVVRWHDNNVVTVVSSQDGVAPQKTVHRWSKAQNARIVVQQPYAITRYNQCMGGTDLMDQRIANYRIKLRSRKWWYALFKWGMDAAMSNAHYIHKSLPSTRSVDLLSFRRSVATTWLRRYGKINFAL